MLPLIDPLVTLVPCCWQVQSVVFQQNNPKMTLLVALSPVCPLAWEFVAARLLEGREPDSSVQEMGSTVNLKESNGPNGPNVREESSSLDILQKATLHTTTSGLYNESALDTNSDLWTQLTSL